MSERDIVQFPLIKRLPRRLRKPLWTGASLLGMGLAAAGCAGGGEVKNGGSGSANTNPSEPGRERIIEPNRFLDLPFAKDRNMGIQQGWTSDFEPTHGAFDYILGQVDNSGTWQKFRVLAAGDGKACANPPSRQGNAVFIEHDLANGGILYTYYGHLSEIASGIPNCGTDTKAVRRGDEIGISGATGVKNDKGIDEPKWVHLHFSVAEGGTFLDPYDIAKAGEKATRDVYPDPNLTNGKVCGEQTLWINCPTGQAVKIAAGGPTPDNSTIEQKIIPATVPPTLVPTPRIETPTPILPTATFSPTTVIKPETVSCPPLANVWRDITPGVSTKNEVLSKLGTPLKIENLAGREILYFPSVSQARPHSIIVEQGKVILIKEEVTSSDTRKIRDYILRFGPVEKLLYGQYGLTIAANYWGCKGVAVWAGEFDRDGVIFGIWYFLPMDYQKILQMNFGLRLTPLQERAGP